MKKRSITFQDPLISTTDWIWIGDPAVDFKRRSEFGKDSDEEWKKYQDEIVTPIVRKYNDTNDHTLIPIKPDWDPILWSIGKLTEAQIQELNELGIGSVEEKIARVAYGVRNIKGLHTPDGDPIKIELVEGHNGNRLPTSVLTWIINDEMLLDDLYWKTRIGGMLSSGQRKSDPPPVLDS